MAGAKKAKKETKTNMIFQHKDTNIGQKNPSWLNQQPE